MGKLIPVSLTLVGKKNVPLSVNPLEVIKLSLMAPESVMLSINIGKLLTIASRPFSPTLTMTVPERIIISV